MLPAPIPPSGAPANSPSSMHRVRGRGRLPAASAGSPMGCRHATPSGIPTSSSNDADVEDEAEEEEEEEDDEEEEESEGNEEEDNPASQAAAVLSSNSGRRAAARVRAIAVFKCAA